MMIKQTMTKKPMTFRFALAYLEGEFDSTYRGIKTVFELNQMNGLGMYWENESPDKEYHFFETKQGNDRIVSTDNIIPLAQSYWGQSN